MAKKKGRKGPQTHHAFYVSLVIAGFLLPPLAVLMRFGVGRDFFINIIFTLCGYFPGHGHNFYLQNIRNNKGRGRTPKWALKYGLVKDDSEAKKSKSQWAHRYDERLANNAYDDPSGFHDEHGNPVANGGATPNDRNRNQNQSRVQDSSLLPEEEVNARDLERHDSNSTRGSNRNRYEDYNEAPGAGDRAVRQRKKQGGLKALVSGNKSPKSNDRFARMEAERDRAGYGEYNAGGDDLGGTDWINEGRSDPPSLPPKNSSSRSNGDPLGAGKTNGSAKQQSTEANWSGTDDVPAHQF